MALQGWVATLKIATTVAFFVFFTAMLVWTMTRDRDEQESRRMLVFDATEETDG